MTPPPKHTTHTTDVKFGQARVALLLGHRMTKEGRKFDIPALPAPIRFSRNRLEGYGRTNLILHHARTARQADIHTDRMRVEKVR